MFASEKFAPLKAFYMFLVPSLSEESWNYIEQFLEVRSFKKGEMILKEGNVCNHVSFLNYGAARIYYHTPDGREKVACFFNENTYVCDYKSFLTRTPATESIQALDATELIETNFTNLQLIYERVPEANKLGRIIAEQMFIKLVEGNASAQKESIEVRYNRLIAEEPWLLQKVPQYMIASYLGVTPEAFSRVKARMNKPKALVTA